MSPILDRQAAFLTHGMIGRRWRRRTHRIIGFGRFGRVGSAHGIAQIDF